MVKDGKDVYLTLKSLGRYKNVPRTNGVSTTNPIDRVLSFAHNVNNNSSYTATRFQDSTYTIGSGFIMTLSWLASYMPKRRDDTLATTVYVLGDFDLMHPGHVDVLEHAALLGGKVLAGVLSDRDVSQLSNSHQRPFLTMHERALGVLACKYVDDVVLDAPSAVTSEFIARFNIAAVVVMEGDPITLPRHQDLLSAAKARGILHIHNASLTTDALIRRISRKRGIFIQ